MGEGGVASCRREVLLVLAVMQEWAAAAVRMRTYENRRGACGSKRCHLQGRVCLLLRRQSINRQLLATVLRGVVGTRGKGAGVEGLIAVPCMLMWLTVNRLKQARVCSANYCSTQSSASHVTRFATA